MKKGLIYDRKIEELAQQEQQEVGQETQGSLISLMQEIATSNEDLVDIKNELLTITKSKRRSLLTHKELFDYSTTYVNHIADIVSEKIITLRQSQIRPSLATLKMF